MATFESLSQEDKIQIRDLKISKSSHSQEILAELFGDEKVPDTGRRLLELVSALRWEIKKCVPDEDIGKGNWEDTETGPLLELDGEGEFLLSKRFNNELSIIRIQADSAIQLAGDVLRLYMAKANQPDDQGKTTYYPLSPFQSEQRGKFVYLLQRIENPENLKTES